MSHAHHDQIAIPRALLLGSAAMIAISLILVASVRLLGLSTSAPAAPAIAERQLTFEDLPDGGIRITDAATRRDVSILHGEQGFVRGVVRSLARERKRDGIGSAQPFLLVARTDGRLTLYDPQTGKRVDLESFGPTNASMFAALLVDAPTKP